MRSGPPKSDTDICQKFDDKKFVYQILCLGFQSGLVNNLSRYICDLVLIGPGLVTTETRVQSSTETRVWCLVSHIIASHKADKVTGPESHLALARLGIRR